MTTQLLKQELIGWLNQLTDKRILEALNSIKDSVQGGDWYDQLTDSQKESLEKSILDYKNGNYLEDEAFWSRYEKKG
jgi:hypothetical protein